MPTAPCWFQGLCNLVRCLEAVSDEPGTTRATVSPKTLAAPAFLSTREHASSVAPVVNTSSTSKMHSLSTRTPWRVA